MENVMNSHADEVFRLRKLLLPTTSCSCAINSIAETRGSANRLLGSRLHPGG